MRPWFCPPLELREDNIFQFLVFAIPLFGICSFGGAHQAGGIGIGPAARWSEYPAAGSKGGISPVR